MYNKDPKKAPMPFDLEIIGDLISQKSETTLSQAIAKGAWTAIAFPSHKIQMIVKFYLF